MKEVVAVVALIALTPSLSCSARRARDDDVYSTTTLASALLSAPPLPQPEDGFMSRLLDKLTSGDPHQIWESACAIATLRDASELNILCAHLPDIERATRGIELGGMLYPNREHLSFALRKLPYYKAGAGCLCHLYPERLMFNPVAEEEAGNIRILETTRSSDYNAMYRCECALCGTQFLVEEGEYHYTWWQWSQMKP